MSIYLPPGCLETMIPGNRPEDELAEAYADALETAIAQAKVEGSLPEHVDWYDVLGDLEAVEDELWGEPPEIVARAAVERYVERMDDGEEGGDDEDEAERVA